MNEAEKLKALKLALSLNSYANLGISAIDDVIEYYLQPKVYLCHFIFLNHVVLLCEKTLVTAS